MSKTLKLSVITSFVGLWLTSYLSNKYQTILGFIFILSFGVLHGANDLILINSFKTKKKLNFFKLIGIYVLIVGISVILFTNFPIIALLLFILVSSYHFGEQHWSEIIKTKNTFFTLLFQFNYGLLILFVLFYFNSNEVIKIIYEITRYRISESNIEGTMLVALLIFVLSSIRLYYTLTEFKNNIIEQLFYLIVLAIVFKASSLIWGFTIYFIFWHSIPSLNDQLTFLYGSATWSNFKKYFKTAFIYWFISLVGIFGLYYIAKDMLEFDALFFAFLASITFPHCIVILNMFRNKSV
jgi:Brp/Blh family beta-carotene 15,15'-monooxygenase